MNMYQSFSRVHAGFLPAALLFLAACGGGGGGGGGGSSAVVYGGNISPAVITTTNASTIAANVIGGDDSAGIIGGVSAESSSATQNQGTGAADLARLLGRDFRKLVVSVKFIGPNQQAVSGVQIDITEPCDGGNGTIRIFGPLDDITLTGTITVVFTNCLISGITLNGTGTMEIDVFLTVFTMSFARLTLRGSGLSIDAGGSLRFEEIGNTETITLNLVEQNNNTGKMRQSANFVIVNLYDNILSPVSFTQTLMGQVFHSDYGFVNVATTPSFVFGPPIQLFPDSGQMLLTGAPEGAGNRTIRVTALTAPPAALPATLAMLELDLDGDGNFEINARVLWTQLSGPMGADLADGDGDGMHNSWETFHGAPLDPSIADAGGDADVDMVTNINEYLAGTDPTP